MMNFRIVFSQPWLLLLLIPAIALTLIPYFRLSKRHRRTRNRITSIVLHLIVMFLATFTLAGMRFEYQEPNDENEIILLVDVSDTEEQSQIARDEFVEIVLNDGKFDNYKIGIVTFGYDQRYVAPLTYEVEGLYDKYLGADTPDTTATNLADALTYSASLFSKPETAKIVLITDGKETDKDANKVIRSVAAQGIRVDVAYIPSDYEEDIVQLSNIELPTYHLVAGEEFAINLTVQSKQELQATINLFDNGEQSSVTPAKTVQLTQGAQSISFTHKIAATDEGFHEICFELSLTGDGVVENNVYKAYLNIETFNAILIIERADESGALVQMLNDQDKYNISVKNINDADMPTSVDELREYDQVILNNISFADIKSAYNDKPVLLDELLDTYVSEYGGGLFTVGGNDEKGNANAYNRNDLKESTYYKKLIPVQAINYTPPIGVVFILDKSGSMTASDRFGKTYLDLARSAIANCLSGDSETGDMAVFNSRDYIGLMTLDSEQEVILELTSYTQRDTILSAVNTIENATGGTVFSPAIERAGQLLRSCKNVDKRHIVIITDGGVATDDTSYLDMVKNFRETDGITCSVMGIDMEKNSDSYNKMYELTQAAGGQTIIASTKDVTSLLRKELSAPEINEVNIPEGGFSPLIYNSTSILVRGVETGTGADKNKMTAKLDGFYGVKLKESDAVELVLTGEYDVPIYAQWKYGKGMVGSFMCDLNEQWSVSFMYNSGGQKFIKNVVNNLMPMENIRPSEIVVLGFEEDNYTNTLQIDANLREGEYVKGELYSMDDEETPLLSLNTVTVDSEEQPLNEQTIYVTTEFSEATRYSRCAFVIKESGCYKIVLTKYLGEQVVDTLTIYKTLSYSEEYNAFIEVEDEDALPENQLANLAKRGEGDLIKDLQDPWEIFSGFITALDKSYDPRNVFMIVAICLFLLDIAVRKFKFKWPHEIIRDIKNKRNSK